MKVAQLLGAGQEGMTIKSKVGSMTKAELVKAIRIKVARASPIVLRGA
ncbi:MAG: hypothetical protein V1857_07225 [archaeon]